MFLIKRVVFPGNKKTLGQVYTDTAQSGYIRYKEPMDQIFNLQHEFQPNYLHKLNYIG